MNTLTSTLPYVGTYTVACLAVAYVTTLVHSERKVNFWRLFFIAFMLTPISVILHELIASGGRKKLRNDEQDAASKTDSPLR